MKIATTYLVTRTLILLVLIGVTLFVHNRFEKFEPVGSQFIGDSVFSGATIVSADEPHKQFHRLINQQAGEGVSVTEDFHVPTGVTDIRVLATVRATGISEGEFRWNAGRILLVRIDPLTMQPDYRGPHKLFALNGSHDWAQYERVFHVYEGTSLLRFQAQLGKVTGTLDVMELSVQAVQYRWQWPYVQSTMIASLVIFLLWVFSAYLRQIRKGPMTAVALAGVAAILVFTAMPHALKSTIYGWLLPVIELLPWVVERSVESGSSEIIGGSSSAFFWLMHFAFFTGATAALLEVEADRPVHLRLYDMVTLALCTEAIQAYVRDRGASPGDAGVDIAGILLGWLLWTLYRRIGKRLQSAT